jgi:hypothetical protein
MFVYVEVRGCSLLQNEAKEPSPCFTCFIYADQSKSNSHPDPQA